MSVAATDAPAVPGLPVRDTPVELARFIGIVLVVFGHTWRGLHRSGVLGTDPFVMAVDAAIYLFHMPLFFLISGFFFERALSKTPEDFVNGRIRRLLYPLVIWTWLFGLAKLAAGGAANVPLAEGGFPWNPFPPQWQFWFLWALFAVHLTAYATGRLSNRTGTWVALAGFAVVAHWGLGHLELLHWTYDTALYNLPFFVAGLLLARFPSLLSGPVWIALAVYVAGQAAFIALPPIGTVAAVAIGLGVTVAVFRMAHALADCPRLADVIVPLAAIGTLSLPIYLAHTIFAAPTRIGLLQLGLTDPLTHIIFGTLAGLTGPIVMALTARRLGLSRVLGL